MSAHRSLPAAGPSNSQRRSITCKFCDEELDAYATREIRCGHRLHLHCMNQFLPYTKCCPVCEAEIRWIDISLGCVGCYNHFCHGENVLKNHCSHLYHQKCIDETMATNRGCRFCRKDILVIQRYLAIDEFSDESEENYVQDDGYFKSGRDDKVLCTICKESFRRGKPHKRMKCGHTMHVHCLDSYMPQAKRCPACRHPIKWIPVTNKCVICLDPLSQAEEWQTMPCKHQCHPDCLEQLLTTKCRCPICKRKIVATSKECVICLENFTGNNVRKRLPCNHDFHHDCISSWLQVEKTCPLCRDDVIG